MKVFILTVATAGILFFAALPVGAADPDTLCSPPGAPGCTTTQSTSNASAGVTTLPSPIGTNDPRVVIGYIIKAVLGLVGSVALLLFIYGGLLMMTAAGNAERVTQGRNTLVWATIGLIVIFGSYVVVSLLFQTISTFKNV